MGKNRLVFIAVLSIFLINAGLCWGTVVMPGYDAAVVFENRIDTVVVIVVVKSLNSPDMGLLFVGAICSDGSNWYVYCGNNPLKYVDPNGLDYYFFTVIYSSSTVETHHEVTAEGRAVKSQTAVTVTVVTSYYSNSKKAIDLMNRMEKKSDKAPVPEVDTIADEDVPAEVTKNANFLEQENSVIEVETTTTTRTILPDTHGITTVSENTTITGAIIDFVKGIMTLFDLSGGKDNTNGSNENTQGE